MIYLPEFIVINIYYFEIKPTWAKRTITEFTTIGIKSIKDVVPLNLNLQFRTVSVQLWSHITYSLIFSLCKDNKMHNGIFINRNS
jgi:hypothetical protein